MHPFNVQVLPAVFTPMYDDGTVNYNNIQALYRHCTESGFTGIFLNGTTGECMSLNTDERMKLVETWIDSRSAAGNPGFKIFVHVGSSNLFEAAEMASHAQRTGADAIAMVPPFYFRPKTISDLLEQCRYVAAAAPELPFYYYNIPSLTGVNFPLTAFVERAIKEIPTFAGLKNSFSDLVDYQQCLHAAAGRYTLYWGTDEVFIMLYAGGNRHYVGSTYNFMWDLYTRMLEAYEDRNSGLLTSLESTAANIYRILNENNGLIAGKEVMRMIGIDCGPVRGPLRKMRETEGTQLRDRLERARFFEFAPRPTTVTDGVTARAGAKPAQTAKRI